MDVTDHLLAHLFTSSMLDCGYQRGIHPIGNSGYEVISRNHDSIHKGEQTMKSLG